MRSHMQARPFIQLPALFVLLTACFAIANTGWARSIGGQVVDNVTAYTEDGTIKLKLEFVVPVHYQWRFPKGFNNQIMISLQPLKRDPELPTNIREDIRVPDSMTGLINEMYIDGTEGANLLLVIHTSSEINPDIKQDRASSGITLSLDKTQIKNSSDIECDKELPGKK
jgi:hypothetical protein